MTNNELIEKLSELPDGTDVWMPVYNGHTTTYGVVDYVLSDTYSMFSNDFFGTPGRMDKRLFENHKHNDSAIVACLSSKFGEYKNEEVDCGDDDINYDIREINGPDGDEDLVWKLNEFKWNNDIECWTRQWFDDKGQLIYEVTYHKPLCKIHIMNGVDEISANGKFVGIEDLRTLMDVCKIPCPLYI